MAGCEQDAPTGVPTTACPCPGGSPRSRPPPQGEYCYPVISQVTTQKPRQEQRIQSHAAAGEQRSRDPEALTQPTAPRGLWPPEKMPPPGREAPGPLTLTCPAGPRQQLPQPWSQSPGSGAGAGILDGHSQGHFLPFLLIQALVPSWATEEFPVPCSSSRAWGQHENDDSAGVRADAWGSTELQNHRTLARPGSCGGGGGGGHLAAPWTPGRKTLVLKGSDTSCWAGWPGGCIKAWPRPLGRCCPGLLHPLSHCPCPGTG